VSLAPWLVGAAVVLLLLEVFERRSGLLSRDEWQAWLRSVPRDRRAIGRCGLTELALHLKQHPDIVMGFGVVGLGVNRGAQFVLDRGRRDRARRGIPAQCRAPRSSVRLSK